MTDLRPRLVFRIGVTGHRKDLETIPRIVAEVEACLTFVRDEVARLAATPEGQGAYAAPDKQPSLRVVSPLAEGADRIVAAAARRLHLNLYAPLPFAQIEYEKDFPDSRAEFEGLLDGVQTFELDGARDGGAAQAESYEAVGRYVVRNCDLLIAIWDGERARGQGGAGEIVPFAARAGVRVWWIHAKDNQPAKLIRSVADFHALARAPQGEDALGHLRDYLRRELLPPAYGRPEREGALGRLAEFWRASKAQDDAPLQEFYAETKLARWPLWQANALFMKVLNVETSEDFLKLIASQKSAAAAPPRGSWEALYQAADRASGDYGDRYRSSYVLAAGLAIVALSSAAFGAESALSTQAAFVGTEIVGLLMIALLVFVNDAWRWHERWIAYRLLAELARKQRVLALIGQTLPGADVRLLAPQPDNQGDADDEKPPRDAWVAWLFMAHRRASPPPTGAMRQAKSAALAAGRALLAEQIDYHETRRKRSRRAGAIVRAISEGFFFATILVALFKLGLIAADNGESIHKVVFVAAVVSSVATAFVGIRAYAEFSLLVRQSTHMIHALKEAGDELDSQAPGIKAAQTSLQLGRTLYATTTAMMQDISGWAQLFRVKTLETL
jgi:hypothetical protein